MSKAVKDVSRIFISRKHLKKIQSVKIYDGIRVYKTQQENDILPLIAAVLSDIYVRTQLHTDNNNE